MVEVMEVVGWRILVILSTLSRLLWLLFARLFVLWIYFVPLSNTSNVAAFFSYELVCLSFYVGLLVFMLRLLLITTADELMPLTR